MMRPTYLSFFLTVLIITAASLIRDGPTPLLEAHGINVSRLEFLVLHQAFERRKIGGGKSGKISNWLRNFL